MLQLFVEIARYSGNVHAALRVLHSAQRALDQFFKNLLGGFARGSELWADDAIEARPDVLWLMRRESPQLQVRWARGGIQSGEHAPIGGYMLLRTDRASGERLRYAEDIDTGHLMLMQRASVRHYEFSLYQVRDRTGERGK